PIIPEGAAGRRWSPGSYSGLSPFTRVSLRHVLQQQIVRTGAGIPSTLVEPKRTAVSPLAEHQDRIRDFCVTGLRRNQSEAAHELPDPGVDRLKAYQNIVWHVSFQAEERDDVTQVEA